MGEFVLGFDWVKRRVGARLILRVAVIIVGIIGE